MAHYIAYKILPELHCIVEYYSGEIGLYDLLEYQKRVSVDTHYDPSFNIISDFYRNLLENKGAKVNISADLNF